VTDEPRLWVLHAYSNRTEIDSGPPIAEGESIEVVALADVVALDAAWSSYWRAAVAGSAGVDRRRDERDAARRRVLP